MNRVLRGSKVPDLVNTDQFIIGLMRLVLASRSPRRVRLMRDAGYTIEVEPADIDERPMAGETPPGYVARLAAAKAEAVAARRPGRPVLGADTVVVIDGTLLGKPGDRVEAAAMLRRLSGRTHTVLTGVALRLDRWQVDGVETTRVTFAPLDAARIDRYVATGEPDDKAGAYAAQGIGACLIDRVEGSYTNVVGLPMALVDRLVRQLEADREASPAR